MVALTVISGDPIHYARAQGSRDGETITPIKHFMVIIGENRTFDHVFATYTPKNGERVDNLLSKGIVKADGKPGPNYNLAAQNSARDTTTYSISPGDKTLYNRLPPALTDGAPEAASNTSPPPFATVAAVAEVEAIEDGLSSAEYPLLTTGATGLASHAVDTRIPHAADLPNGPFRLSADMPYDSYTASPVHRFYQMWQQLDCAVDHATARNPSGCLKDLFPWVEVTIGAGSNGNPQVANFTNETTGEGSTSMGFYSMAQGDAPSFKKWADEYTISDNYHQAVAGGTYANHAAFGTGLAYFYADSSGNPATPPANEIENPNPESGTNNWYAQDGYSGGSLSNCSDRKQPGVGPILQYLSALPYHPKNTCAANAYYLLNNYNPGYLGDGTVDTAAFTLPPSKQPTIGDVMTDHGVSWKYFGQGWDQYVANPNAALGSLYCNICNPFQYQTRWMTNAAARQEHFSDMPELLASIKAGDLPAVSFVKPDGLQDGHPASSKLDLFEAFVDRVKSAVEANDKLARDTAILVTFDEGGGYWDSGYVQTLDFFGDGTRIPAVMISPFSRGGHISHNYADHMSIPKFIEKNWNLPRIASNTRDNMPNPEAYTSNPYVPVNSPAIGDLMDMFNFPGQ